MWCNSRKYRAQNSFANWLYIYTYRDEAAGLATPSVTNVGCGRATYSCCALYAGKGGDVAGSSSSSRVEALVCNYGPIETELDAVPRRCETPSPLYSELCRKLRAGLAPARNSIADYGRGSGERERREIALWHDRVWEFRGERAMGNGATRLMCVAEKFIGESIVRRARDVL